ncbi:TPA: hypothetical protein N0F65_006172, partial [Lagenidium giganteum]
MDMKVKITSSAASTAVISGPPEVTVTPRAFGGGHQAIPAHFVRQILFVCSNLPQQFHSYQHIWSSKMFQPGFADFAFHSMTTAVANDDLKYVPLARRRAATCTLDVAHFPTSKRLPRIEANDGLVNTISMRYDGEADVVDGPSESKTGRWHHLAKFTTLDHLAIIGFKPQQNVLDVYKTHAKLLHGLPA